MYGPVRRRREQGIWRWGNRTRIVATGHLHVHVQTHCNQGLSCWVTLWSGCDQTAVGAPRCERVGLRRAHEWFCAIQLGRPA